MNNSLELSNKSFLPTTYLSPFTLSLLYIVFFVLLYIEPLEIGGAKISIIWKVAFISYCLMVNFITVLQEKKIFLFVLFSLLLAIKTFFSLSSMEYFQVTIELFIENLFFPVLFLYFAYHVDEEVLNFLGKHFSIFIILSSSFYCWSFDAPI